MKARPCIIDTDGGVDDALALLLALSSPELEVKAITVVAGNTDVVQAVKNVYRLLKLVSREDILVGIGAARPLKRALHVGKSIHGADGLGELDQYYDGSQLRYKDVMVPSNLPEATGVLVSMAKEYGARLTLVTLGPLTNIALACQEAPECMRCMGEMIIMGGAIRVPGNMTAVAEFNIWADPEAAAIVFETIKHPLLVGLDVTSEVIMSAERVYELLRLHPSAIAQFVVDCTAFYAEFYREADNIGGFPLHDPLAMGVAINRQFVRLERLHVDIETEGKWTAGATVGDTRRRRDRDESGLNVDVAVAVEAEAFKSFFESRVWNF